MFDAKCDVVPTLAALGLRPKHQNVWILNPLDQRTAAWNAAPIVGRLIPRIGPQLGVLPDESRDIDLTDLEPLVGSGAH